MYFLSHDVRFSVTLITSMISDLRHCHSYFFITVIQKGSLHSFLLFVSCHWRNTNNIMLLGEFSPFVKNQFFLLVLTALTEDVGSVPSIVLSTDQASGNHVNMGMMLIVD